MLRAALLLFPVVIVVALALQGTAAYAQTPPAPPVATATASPSTAPAGSATPPSCCTRPSPTPPGATTWPNPTNLRVTTVVRLVDDAGRPLPPEQQEHADVLSWDHTQGSDGQYNIEVTLVPIDGRPASVMEPYILFPADRGNGTIRRISQYPEWLQYQRCYRIRITLPKSDGTVEVRPFQEPACTLKPPTGGPGATPGAPGTGTGSAPASTDDWEFALAGAALALGAGSAGFVRFRTRRS